MSDLAHLAPEINLTLKNAKKILIHCHPSPDGDSIGGALGMWHLLQDQGYAVDVIIGDSAKPRAFNFLPGFDQILEKNFTQVNLNHYDVFLAQDSAGLEMITRLEPVVFPEHLKVIVIDHHPSNTRYGHINLVLDQEPSNCQVIYQLAKELGWKVSPAAAICLLVGIYTDTGGFRYLKTQAAQTFQIAAELTMINPDLEKAIFELDNHNDANRLIAEGIALSNIRQICDDQVAISIISYADIQKHQLTARDTEKLGIANKLISVDSWQIGISMIETEPNQINVSIRTRDAQQYDLTKLAKALGGGGHKAAAGANFDNTIEQAIDQIEQKIHQLYPEL